MRTVLLALALTFVAASPNESLLDLPVRGESGASKTVRALVGEGPAVVSLWATYCAPCKMEVPVLNGAAERYGEQGLRVIGVVVDTDDPEEVRAVAESWGIEYSVVWTPADERPHVQSLVPRGLPTTFFIRGDRVRRHEGVLDDAGIDKMIRPLLAPAPKAPTPPSTLTLEPTAW
jgi:thiol-disulfide isomerase/thioredoxin